MPRKTLLRRRNRVYVTNKRDVSVKLSAFKELEVKSKLKLREAL